jgi:hypothetical protein
MSSGSFDVELERDVLAQCLRDAAYLRRAVPVLRRHDFASPALRWLWGVLADVYSTTRELPSPHVWGLRLDRDFAEDEQRAYHEEVLLGLWRRRSTSPRAALEEVRRFVQMAAVRASAAEALGAIDDGEVDEAARMIAEGAKAARTAGALDEPESWATSGEARLAGYRAAPVGLRVATPFLALDRALGGGLRPGCLGLVVATTNIGKSALAVDLGFTALTRAKAAVAHVTTEETKAEALARYDARYTGIPRDRLMASRLLPGEGELIEAKFRKAARWGRRLQVQEIPPRSPVSAVAAFVESVRAEFPDDLLVVVVDSPDHLEPDRKAENYRLGASAVYWALKGLALDPTLGPAAVWATVQAPAKFAGKRLTSEAVSESYDKARVADAMAGLMESEGDEGEETEAAERNLQLVLVKNRLGGIKRLTVYCVANLGTCSFREVAARRPAPAEEGA